MKIKPLFNNVLLKPVKAGEKKLSSGIVLPTSREEGSWLCEVIAVGPGVLVDGYFREIPKEIKPGAQVYIPAFPGYITNVDGQEYRQCKDTEILSVVETDAK